MKTFLTALLPMLVLCACGSTEEDRIASRVDELVDAMNNHDVTEASRLFEGASIPAINDDGDSSTLYRLLALDGARDFEAQDVESVVIEDRARTSFRLDGTMTHGDTTLGTMGMLMHLELERVDGEWRFIPGRERKETGF